ncbi:Extracellular metalloprotease VDBG_01143, partial [Durusdinium trenchii]
MRSNSRVLLSALVVTVSTAALLFAQLPREGFVFNGRRFASQLDFIQQGCRCSTRTPSADVIAAIEKALQARGGRVAASSAVEIPVQFIHITDGANGQITETQRLDQVQVLNDSYSAWGITFLYDPMVNPPIFEDNASWYRMTPGSAAERQAKAALQVDPTKNLNFYTAGIGQGLLGWATFPNQLQSDPTNDGVVCLDESLPGGSAAPYNLGDTATHEVGHWLGLFHTFQNGCFGQGDQVNDTPAHSSPNYGCPDPTQPNGACVQGELAPVENFMNYTDDICMIEFTLGQSDRMHSMIETYRPGLLGEDPCDCPITCIQRAIPPALRFDDEVLDLLRDFRDLVLH